MNRLKKSERPVEFLASELDDFVAKWIAGGLSKVELEEWKRMLTFETRFREQFAEWIKCLREPAWIRDPQFTLRKARS